MQKFSKITVLFALLFLGISATKAQKWYIGTPDTTSITATLVKSTLIIEGTGQMQDFDEGTAPWYCIRTNIQNLIIGKKISRIGNYAFQDCNSLTGILTIPNYCKSIGKGAFENCSGLYGTLIIPNSVKTIGDYAFRSCIGFTSATMNSINFIGNQSFANCFGLTDVLIGSSIISIGNAAFTGCKAIINIKGNNPNIYNPAGNSRAYIE